MAFTKEEANVSDSIKCQGAHIYLGKYHVCGQTQYMLLSVKCVLLVR